VVTDRVAEWRAAGHVSLAGLGAALTATGGKLVEAGELPSLLEIDLLLNLEHQVRVYRLPASDGEEALDLFSRKRGQIDVLRLEIDPEARGGPRRAEASLPRSLTPSPVGLEVPAGDGSDGAGGSAGGGSDVDREKPRTRHVEGGMLFVQRFAGGSLPGWTWLKPPGKPATRSRRSRRCMRVSSTGRSVATRFVSAWWPGREFGPQKGGGQTP
jgi:hypothetical protein